MAPHTVILTVLRNKIWLFFLFCSRKDETKTYKGLLGPESPWTLRVSCMLSTVHIYAGALLRGPGTGPTPFSAPDAETTGPVLWASGSV